MGGCVCVCVMLCMCMYTTLCCWFIADIFSTANNFVEVCVLV